MDLLGETEETFVDLFDYGMEYSDSYLDDLEAKGDSGNSEADVGGGDFLDTGGQYGSKMKPVKGSEHDRRIAPATGIEGDTCVMFHVIPPRDFEETPFLAMS
jgi:hypothetical protein